MPKKEEARDTQSGSQSDAISSKEEKVLSLLDGLYPLQ